VPLLLRLEIALGAYKRAKYRSSPQIQQVATTGKRRQLLLAMMGREDF